MKRIKKAEKPVVKYKKTPDTDVLKKMKLNKLIQSYENKIDQEINSFKRRSNFFSEEEKIRYIERIENFKKFANELKEVIR